MFPNAALSGNRQQKQIPADFFKDLVLPFPSPSGGCSSLGACRGPGLRQMPLIFLPCPFPIFLPCPFPCSCVLSFSLLAKWLRVGLENHSRIFSLAGVSFPNPFVFVTEGLLCGHSSARTALSLWASSALPSCIIFHLSAPNPVWFVGSAVCSTSSVLMFYISLISFPSPSPSFPEHAGQQESPCTSRDSWVLCVFNPPEFP